MTTTVANAEPVDALVVRAAFVQYIKDRGFASLLGYWQHPFAAIEESAFDAGWEACLLALAKVHPGMFDVSRLDHEDETG